ncbi:MAG TPA: squalene/phytoene synthase family protein [Pseudomonadota bacterium]|nr:squalene/phytoene synthase family protein [Pseudomonadota bacterium]
MLPPPLTALLKRVSRSFFLSVRVLPDEVAAPIGLGYLLARAADTIADTDLLPATTRLSLLGELSSASEGDVAALARLQLALRELLRQPMGQALPSSEQTLLAVLDECLSLHLQADEPDRRLVTRVLGQLVSGMQTDLRRFPAAGSVSSADQVVVLQSLAELDEYTYYAAGCVGEFWTELCAAHLPGLAHLRSPELVDCGVSLGKALQLTNVVRDLAADLRIGRCYIPQPLLDEHGLTCARLYDLTRTPPLDLGEARAMRKLTATLLRLGIRRCDEAWPYVLAIPKSLVRLRLACVWPLFLALDTLAMLGNVGSPLVTPDQPVKVSRQSVYGLVFATTVSTLAADVGASDRFLERQFQHKRQLAWRSVEGS